MNTPGTAISVFSSSSPQVKNAVLIALGVNDPRCFAVGTRTRAFAHVASRNPEAAGVVLALVRLNA
jgi:hypothetical protein